jgi:hypothetical protein
MLTAVALLVATALCGTHAVFETVSPPLRNSENARDSLVDTVDVWVAGQDYRLDTREGVSIIFYESGDSLTWLDHESKSYRTVVGPMPGESAMFRAGDKRFYRGLEKLVDFVQGAVIDSTGKRATVAGYPCKLYILSQRTASGRPNVKTELWVDPNLQPGYYEVGRLFLLANGSIPGESQWSSKLKAIDGFPVRTVVFADSTSDLSPFPKANTVQWLINYEDWDGDAAKFTIPAGYKPANLAVKVDKPWGKSPRK